MKKPIISFLIRTRNEAPELDILLGQITAQKDLPRYEIIIVDSESTDDIGGIAQKYGATITTIKHKDFSYPKAWNQGLKLTRGKFICFISAHSQLHRKTSIAQLLTYFKNTKVAGIYGSNLAMHDAPISEKSIYKLYRIASIIAHSQTTPRPGMLGLFGTAHAIARGDLIRKHPFDEAFGAGGEDSEWGARMIKNGHDILYVKGFKIHHSHGLSLRKQIAQLHYWKSLHAPRPFDLERLNAYRSKKF